MVKSLEESNAEHIIDRYVDCISEQDRYTILSIVASLARENTRLSNELSRFIVRQQMPNSVTNTISKRESQRKGGKRQWYRK